MTLKQMAEATGLSVGFLSQLERGMSSIAIDSLQTIAGVLGVPLRSFFDNEGAQTLDPVIHSFEMPTTEISSQIIQYVLSKSPEDFDFLPRIFQLMPFANSDEDKLEMYSHSGEEFIFVLEGVITMYIEDRQYTMYPGDSTQIQSNLSHNWMNRTNKVARILTVNTPNPLNAK
jgi:Uncharacterized conserved protein, contains double-stranded beta-helix domain